MLLEEEEDTEMICSDIAITTLIYTAVVVLGVPGGRRTTRANQ